MAIKLRTWRVALLAGCATVALGTALPAAASAEGPARQFSIGAQDLDAALKAFAMTSGHDVVFDPALVQGHTTAGVSGAVSDEEALRTLLAGTNLAFEQTSSGGFVVRAPRFQGAADEQAGGSDGTVAALIVTAQKREEQIQDVPIAISAFTEKSLEEQKIEGGFDLLKAIPNVTFSKNNFTSYNFSIRGIGTKAISATTDPGVAVSFNNASLIQNRLFEQEYFDVERVEVLRGPQGTLYGRNATAGVINVISAKPNLREFDGWVKGEVGNYHAKRISAMVNVPLVEDKLAIRFAGALTDRQGYDFNDTTKHAVNGRDLWSGRITIAFNPIEQIRTSLLWERFNEDDNRSRTGKQLCKRDPGLTHIGSAPVGAEAPWSGYTPIRQAFFSQGCSPVSLYDDAAYQTPNGLALPYVGGAAFAAFYFSFGYYPNNEAPTLVSPNANIFVDPYASREQSRDLRRFNSPRDPIYRAKADILQFSFDADVAEGLTLTSQTTYDADEVYSFQDFNRFTTRPTFPNTSNLIEPGGTGPSPWQGLAPGGVFCDPQIGCSNTIAGFDISKAKSTQFLQEIRLASAYDGPVNFSVGVNYTRFSVLADYYVMFNLLTALSMTPPFNLQGDPTKCNTAELGQLPEPVAAGDPQSGCPYIDPNPVESINGEGHNYFRSKNPYRLHSSAAFGELYWNLNPTVKVTAGLRYTDDRKTFTPVPSQLLLGRNIFAGGVVNKGYPADPDIKQHWGEFTGRLGVDWKPDLGFTDQTLLYAFYSRGYKGGGANPPGIGYGKKTIAEIIGLPPGTFPPFDHPMLYPTAQNTTPTFKPEFVNAFEVGAKNTLLGGGLTFNATTFFYDYKDYQVSKVVDRSVANENFDARIWGLEFETVFAPTRNLRFLGNFGYLDTSIGKGAKSIDVMNRTQGDPNWVLVKQWFQYPSNCVVSKNFAEAMLLQYDGAPGPLAGGCGPFFLIPPGIDPDTGNVWDPSVYPEINGGAGIAQDLSGNELPNSPHWTANIGGQYSIDFANSWKATIRADGYWQSQSWARVYNAVNDKLHGWYNANVSLWLENEDGLKIEIYAKNILDKTPITDSFINSDDTGLTTNVFTLDPRLIGLSIKKDF